VFRTFDDEFASTATGHVFLRAEVRATDGTFLPAVPLIAGLTPLETHTGNGESSALFEVDGQGLLLLEVSGASATPSGSFTLNLDVAGDINGDGKVDGMDSGLLADAFGTAVGDARYNAAADLDGDGRVDLTDRLLLVADFGFVAHQARVVTVPPDRPAFG